MNIKIKGWRPSTAASLLFFIAPGDWLRLKAFAKTSLTGH